MYPEGAKAPVETDRWMHVSNGFQLAKSDDYARFVWSAPIRTEIENILANNVFSLISSNDVPAGRQIIGSMFLLQGNETVF